MLIGERYVDEARVLRLVWYVPSNCYKKTINVIRSFFKQDFILFNYLSIQSAMFDRHCP